MLDLQITGSAELRYVAGKLRKAAAIDLRKELAKAQRKTFEPLEREIKAQAIVSLPHTGGYAGVMARAVKVGIRQNIARRELVAVVSARSVKQLRDVRAINRGELRHPVFGRWRPLKQAGARQRNPWVLQKVPPGFVTRPADRLGDRLARESLDALHRVAVEIAR